MKFLKSVFVCSVPLLVVACSHGGFSTKKGNYLAQSKTLPPIVVPSDAVAPNEKPYYTVPKNSVSADSFKPSMEPPGLHDNT